MSDAKAVVGFKKQSRSLKIVPSQINLTEYRRQHWLATPEAGTTVEDLLRPDYWAHICGRFRTMDRIDVLFQDGTFYVELLVVYCDRLNAQVVITNKLDLSALPLAPLPVSIAEDYEVKFRGAASKWSVIRKSDNKIVKDGLNSQSEAQQHMGEHLKALAK